MKAYLLIFTMLFWGGKMCAQGLKKVDVFTDDQISYPRQIDLSPDGRYLYVACEREDAFVYFELSPFNGALTLAGRFDNFTDWRVKNMDSPRSIAVSPNGKFVYGGTTVSDYLMVFSRDSVTGDLSYIELFRDNSNYGLNSIRDIIISSDGRYLYAIGTTDSAINLFAINETNGRLTYIESYQDASLGGTINHLGGCEYFEMDSDGDNLYVGAGLDDAIVVFSRNHETGKLSFIQDIVNNTSGVTGLDNVKKIVLTKQGRHVYAMGKDQNTIVQFSRDTLDGRLEYVQGYEYRSSPQAVRVPLSGTVSPDDKYLYVACGSVGGGGGFAMYGIDSLSGELTKLDRLDNTFAPYTQDLGYPDDIAVSQDGSIIYFSSGSHDDAIHAYSKTDPILGVEIEESRMSIFPNPIQDELRVDNSMKSIREVIIKDLFGNILVQIHPNISETLSISLDHLPAGNYYVQIIFEDNYEIHSFQKL